MHWDNNLRDQEDQIGKEYIAKMPITLQKNSRNQMLDLDQIHSMIF